LKIQSESFSSKYAIQNGAIQNCRQNVVNRGFYVCAGVLTFAQGGLIFTFNKNSIDLWCFIF